MLNGLLYVVSKSINSGLDGKYIVSIICFYDPFPLKIKYQGSPEFSTGPGRLEGP